METHQANFEILSKGEKEELFTNLANLINGILNEADFTSPEYTEIYDLARKGMNQVVVALPLDVPNVQIENAVCAVKKLQDKMDKIKIDNPAHRKFEYDIEVCDKFIENSLYCYKNTSHPHLIGEWTLETDDQKLFNRINKVFFLYVFRGSYSCMPHVYLNLDMNYIKVETEFVANLFKGDYNMKPGTQCTGCKFDLTEDDDHGMFALCGHIMCIVCCQRNSVSRYRMYCETCSEYVLFWFKKELILKKYKVSQPIHHFLKEYGIPESNLEIITEPYTDVYVPANRRNNSASFAGHGMFGSEGCNFYPMNSSKPLPTPAVIQADEEYTLATVNKKAILNVRDP